MPHFCNDPRGRRRIQDGVRDARVLFNFFAKETDEREGEGEGEGEVHGTEFRV